MMLNKNLRHILYYVVTVSLLCLDFKPQVPQSIHKLVWGLGLIGSDYLALLDDLGLQV